MMSITHSSLNSAKLSFFSEVTLSRQSALPNDALSHNDQLSHNLLCKSRNVSNSPFTSTLEWNIFCEGNSTFIYVLSKELKYLYFFSAFQQWKINQNFKNLYRFVCLIFVLTVLGMYSWVPNKWVGWKKCE